MSLIPAQPGTMAIISGPDGKETNLTVQAWNENGEPMVVAFGHNRLIPASTLGQVDLGTAEPIVAVLPGGGWTRTRNCVDDDCLGPGHTHTEPVLAWMIQSSGDGLPVFVASDGETYACDRGTTTCGVSTYTPPGSWGLDTTAAMEAQQ